MKKGIFFLYGVVCYLIFFVTFLYAIGFVTNLVVPKNIDSGEEGPLAMSILINVLILGLFALQHEIMARPAFKEVWTKIVPKPIERSTFVLLASLILDLLFWQWRPLTSVVWEVEQSGLRMALTGLSFAGYGLVLYASVLINHFDLFGLRQVYLYLQGKEYTDVEFADPPLYRLVRNPLMLGFIIAFWATPSMTVGHLLFAAVTTAYIFIGIQLEERDLLNALGEDYRIYRENTSMLLPIPKRKKAI